MNIPTKRRSICLAGACFLLFGLVSFDAAEKRKFFSIPPKRAHHALVYDEGNKTILMTTGSTPLNGGESFDFFNDLWNFNGKEWKKTGNAGNQRSGIQLAFDTKRNKIYSYGGYSGDSSLSDLRVLEAGEWKTVSYLPEMKAAEAGLVYDVARDRLVVFGGSAGMGTANADTWEWNGSSWTKFNGEGPGGRQAFSMIYDSKRKKTMLFGGMGTGPGQRYQDTWEFDGVVWNKVSESGPGARASAGVAYDSNRGMMIIYGGMSNGKFVGDTWGWDGKEWKKLADSGPKARVMGYMAYDKIRDRVVLFGGRLGWPNDADDTWEWDGAAWKEVKSE